MSPRLRLTADGVVPLDLPRHKQSHRRWRHSHTWARLRAEAKRRQPWCSRCFGEDRLEVHHIIAVEDGGPIWDRSNLAVLCADCHKALGGVSL